MAIDTLQNIKIAGITCCTPEGIVEIDEYIPQLGESAIEKFKKTTGVQRKNCCSHNHVITTGDLCYAAAEKLFLELGIDRSSIDLLILVTQSGDYMQPSTACVLQYRLGLSNDCMAYDINLGCSGYVYGIHVAGTYLQSKHFKRALVLAGDAITHAAPLETMLFGEAGSATLLEYDESQPEMNFSFKTMGAGFRHLLFPYGGYRHGIGPKNDAAVEGKHCFVGKMDGAEIFKFSVKEVPALINEYCRTFHYNPDEFDLCVLHQANLIILQQIIKKLKLSPQKVPISLDIYGNTSSASIPLGICDYFNRINPDAKKEGRKEILTCGFGIGLSLGAGNVTVDGQTCFPVIQTNESFEDGVL